MFSQTPVKNPSAGVEERVFGDLGNHLIAEPRKACVALYLFSKILLE